MKKRLFGIPIILALALVLIPLVAFAYLVLTFTENLYDSGHVAIPDTTDIKAKFTAAAGASITSATYNLAAKTVTFVLTGAVLASTVAANAGAIEDIAGNVYAPVTYYYHDGFTKWSVNSDVTRPTASFTSSSGAMPVRWFGIM